MSFIITTLQWNCEYDETYQYADGGLENKSFSTYEKAKEYFDDCIANTEGTVIYRKNRKYKENEYGTINMVYIDYGFESEFKFKNPKFPNFTEINGYALILQKVKLDE